MFKSLKNLLSLMLLLVVCGFAVAPETRAGGKEYEKIVSHLKSKYQAKKVKIPMIWLARFAVRVIRPAGVKSFSITTFENLKFTRATLDAEMQSAMRNAMPKEWAPIMRIRSRKGEQVYMYMRETKESFRIMLVTIDDNKAAVIRAAFNPDKLANFINDPKIFGISLNDNEPGVNSQSAKENAAPAQTPAETKNE